MAFGNDSTLEAVTRAGAAAAVAPIVRALDRFGVVSAYWFLAYAGEPVIWLVTRSDRDKARVTEQGMFTARVQDLLVAAGVPPELAGQAQVTVESEETVERDFEGSWRYAMK